MSCVKRIVLFKFKEGTTDGKIEEIFAGLGSLKAKIPGVKDFTCGAYSSRDGLNQGYSHALIITYQDEASRDGFGPHPEHQNLLGVIGPSTVIAAPHPKSKRTIQRTAELIHRRLTEFDVPENLIQWLEDPSIETTKELMSAVDVIVATGGMGMVKAAYSSGKPAYGVGPGNVQCIIDRGVDIDDAVEKIVEGRVFNDGLPCACEQALIVPIEDMARVLQALCSRQVVYIDDEADISRIAALLGVLSRTGIGIKAPEVARRAGISVPEGTEVLLLEGNMREDNILRREKLSPVMLFYTYQRFEEAIEIARENVLLEGRGHSVSIHSNDREHIEQLATAVDVSRVIVNQCATTSAGGSFLNGFGATTTLGTGFWGNNILNGNLSYRQLLNYTRIGYIPEGAKIPSDEEIWGPSTEQETSLC